MYREAEAEELGNWRGSVVSSRVGFVLFELHESQGPADFLETRRLVLFRFRG